MTDSVFHSRLSQAYLVSGLYSSTLKLSDHNVISQRSMYKLASKEVYNLQSCGKSIRPAVFINRTIHMAYCKHRVEPCK